MKCPRCDESVLDERDRDGVTVDVCRACRGVWLDRGELEKLIARTTRDLDEYERRRSRDDDDDDDDDDDRRKAPRGWRGPEPAASPPHDAHGATGFHGRYPPRKRTWLENLGDLFD